MFRMIARVALALLAIAIVGGGVIYFAVRGHGFSARATPGRTETVVARAARRLAIPTAARQRANPEPATPERIRAGLEHFADHCAVCHGNDGSGDTEMGRGLYPKAPDMRLPQTQQFTEGELFYIIENGVPLTGMPAWGGSSPESERASWHLVDFVRHLPRVTEAEIAAMAQLNPKGPAERDQMDPDQFLNGMPTPTVPAPKHQHGGRGR